MQNKVLIQGEVIHGKGRGHALGIPTVNVQCEHSVQLEQGVYAVRIQIEGQSYAGAMNWGAQPTFNDDELVLEVHILDFDKDAYGLLLEIEVVKKLRDIQKFQSIEELIVQIQADIELVRDLLL